MAILSDSYVVSGLASDVLNGDERDREVLNALECSARHFSLLAHDDAVTTVFVGTEFHRAP